MISSSGQFDIRINEELASLKNRQSDTVCDVTEELASLNTDKVTLNVT